MTGVRRRVLVANSMRAQYYKIALGSSGPGLHVLESFESPAIHDRARDLVSDRPGRVFDSEGEGRHAMVPRSDPRRELKKEFARTLAEKLSADAANYDQLIIVAAPPALGDLRKILPTDVAQKITAQIDEDLTTLAPRELYKRLSDRLPLP